MSSLDRECGVADFGWALLVLLMRSCFADESDVEEELDVGCGVLVGGNAARVERRIGDGM